MTTAFGELTYVKATCNGCNKIHGLNVSLEKLRSYIYNNLPIQNVFPDLNPSQREIIMGNVKGMYLCDVCWDFNFGDDE